MAGKKVAKRKPRTDLGTRRDPEGQTFPDGTKPGDVVKYHWEDGEVVGRLVVSTTGGKLWQGKAPNHKAGPGRPPEEIRAEARNSFAARIARLEAIIDDPRTPARDVTSAMSLLAKLGVASQVEHRGDKGSPIIILPAQQAPMVVQGTPVVEEPQEAVVEALPPGLQASTEEAPTPE